MRCDRDEQNTAREQGTAAALGLRQQQVVAVSPSLFAVIVYGTFVVMRFTGIVVFIVLSAAAAGYIRV